jgi:hypothetical protein
MLKLSKVKTTTKKETPALEPLTFRVDFRGNENPN